MILSGLAASCLEDSSLAASDSVTFCSMAFSLVACNPTQGLSAVLWMQFCWLWFWLWHFLAAVFLAAKFLAAALLAVALLAAAFLAVVGLLMFSFVALLGSKVADLAVLGFSSIVAIFPLLCCCHH